MPSRFRPVSLGLDFGTESVRAILIDTMGNQLGLASHAYAQGQILDRLPGSSARLPERYALQAPRDWIESAVTATRAALTESGIDAQTVVGIGVDFTSCTMLPTRRDGVPLCELEPFTLEPLAWPKLWKHHGALSQTDRLNQVARQRHEPFLQRYGGTIGVEWFFPKLLETIEHAPHVAEAAEVWLEAGDWFVWQLVGCATTELTRSTCQAGYKAMWSAEAGYPSAEYFDAVDPRLAEAVAHRLPGRMRAPGERAGGLCRELAERMGLRPGVPVSTAIIDAHAAVPGVGVAEPGVLVMVLGTSGCHMLNASSEHWVPGIAGVVDGGILPGWFGYETGQAAVGDAFAWLRRLLGLESFESLQREALALPPGAEGVGCLDWMNGCRTPLMDGSLRGVFSGLALHHGPAHLYLALMEASAYGLRWIIELMQSHGVPIHRLVATGGLPHHNRDLVEVYADVLGLEIEIHPSTQGPATGAAVLGMIAAGEPASGFASVTDAARAMAGISIDARDIIRPRGSRSQAYHTLYHDYRRWADAVVSLAPPVR